jgi:peptidyl-prolyl cis-trans isomerase C
MSKRLSFLAIPVLALVAAASPGLADDAPGLDTVVATVNGTDITLGNMVLVRKNLPAQLGKLPDAVLFKGILDQLVNQTLLEQSYKGDEPAEVKIAMENQHRSLMAAQAIENLFDKDLTDEAINKAYDAKYANAEPTREYHAAHILVKTEDEAKAIEKELKDGADFTELAKEKSTGPSASAGGDLGWFTKGHMVPEFENAAMALKPGEVSAPVKTQFGWHVILLKDARMKEAPKLDDVRAQIVSDLQTDLVKEQIAKLTKTATIDRSKEKGFDPTILTDLSKSEH